MLRSRKSSRGVTLVELFSVIIVVGLILTAVAATIGPLLRSQNQTQAKVDTVQAAAMALYRVERDLRNTRPGSIYACTTGVSPTCAPPPTAPAPTSAIVMVTAYQRGLGPFQVDQTTGTPDWQGATVYWVDSQGNLNVAFDIPSGYVHGTTSTLSRTQAAQAVTDVFTTGGTAIARFVQQISLAQPPVGNTVTFQMLAQSTVSGALNETTYQTDVETRND
jgi:type II secretory pathway pseudopilin PulG